MIRFRCAQCGNEVERAAGHVNRARAAGNNLYCGRACAGLGRRRAPLSAEELKERKRLYDIEYRAKNLAEIRAKKAAYYTTHFDRDKERAYRQTRVEHHNEYCRRPEYRTYKREYDKAYRAKAEFGDFWESAVLVNEIHNKAVELAGGARLVNS